MYMSVYMYCVISIHSSIHRYIYMSVEVIECTQVHLAWRGETVYTEVFREVFREDLFDNTFDNTLTCRHET